MRYFFIIGKASCSNSCSSRSPASGSCGPVMNYFIKQNNKKSQLELRGRKPISNNQKSFVSINASTSPKKETIISSKNFCACFCSSSLCFKNILYPMLCSFLKTFISQFFIDDVFHYNFPLPKTNELSFSGNISFTSSCRRLSTKRIIPSLFIFVDKGVLFFISIFSVSMFMNKG